MELLENSSLVLIALIITIIGTLLVAYTFICIIYLTFREGQTMKEDNKKLLEEILNHLTYIVANTNEISVLAECELIKTLVKKLLRGEDEKDIK